LEITTQGYLVLGLPPVVNTAAYLVIGWKAGGSFTRSAMRQFLRLLPLTCTFIVAAIAGCLGLAIMVSAWAGIPFSQAYLATTPGGIYAVLATAMDSGAGPIVVTMQVFRMLVMVMCAVVGSKLLNRRFDGTAGPTATPVRRKHSFMAAATARVKRSLTLHPRDSGVRWPAALAIPSTPHRL